jgi:tripartite ATP-independent transporter DctM subunit
MFPEYIAIIFFVAVLLALLAGYPVAFTLGGLSVIVGVAIFGIDFLKLLPLRIWGIMSNYVLIAVPLFIFMGVMLEKSGTAEELLETMALLFGRLKGGLAISVLLVGTLLGASTGIVGATVVTMGLLSLPVMIKRGYNKQSAAGIIMASGTLGQIIPPSIVLILLGSVLNIAVGDLFIAAVLPGVLLVILYLIWLIISSVIKPESMPAMPEEELERFKGRVRLKKVFNAFVLPAILITAVLGSIFGGFASPTEAAGVGSFGALILTLVRRELNLRVLKEVMLRTTTLTSMVFIILIGATAFGLIFRGLGGDRFLTEIILSSSLEPYHFLILVMITIFICGFFIDFIEITFIVVPIVTPIFIHMGIDLLWVGILIAINLQTSFLTPPFGFAIFYLKAVSPAGISTTDLYKGIVPYVIIQLITIAVIIINPDIALWLPNLFR